MINNPAGRHVIFESILQNLSKQPAAMVSNKVCLDRSTYTDSSQQCYWSQSQSVLFLLNYSHRPVYFTAPVLCLNPYMGLRCCEYESYSSLRTIPKEEERRGKEMRGEERRGPVGPECPVSPVWIAASCLHLHWTHTHTGGSMS